MTTSTLIGGVIEVAFIGLIVFVFANMACIIAFKENFITVLQEKLLSRIGNDA